MRPAWLESLLSDSSVFDICINGEQVVRVDRGQGLISMPHRFETAAAVKEWAISELASVGRTWDAKHPFVDATLEGPTSSHRMHAVFPPIARDGTLVSLRRLARSASPAAASLTDETLGELRAVAKARWSSCSIFHRLVDATRDGEAMIISGATGSGKTTLMNDLLAWVTPAERVIALEDTAELGPAIPHFISLVSRPANADGCGEVTLRTLLKQTLRMRPDRILLGECRGAEVLDLLQALNTGHRGAMATLHASSTRDALRRLELLCLLSAGGTVPIGAIRELIAAGVRWLVHVRSRTISEITRIEGREGDTILLRPLLGSLTCKQGLLGTHSSSGG